MKVDLSTYNNKWYKPGSIIKRSLWAVVSALFFKHSLLPFYGLKVGLLRLFGAQIGKGVVIKPKVNIKYPWFLSIGDNSWVGEEVWIDNLGKTTIGANACLSQGAFLLSGNHDFSSTAFDLIIKPILLEDGAWVGAKAVVCGGAILRSHAVLSVGSVATGELEAFTIYKGNPATKVKERILK